MVREQRYQSSHEKLQNHGLCIYTLADTALHNCSIMLNYNCTSHNLHLSALLSISVCLLLVLQKGRTHHGNRYKRASVAFAAHIITQLM
jgi:hypothetical protein